MVSDTRTLGTPEVTPQIRSKGGKTKRVNMWWT